MELNFEGTITRYDPNSDYPYTVTFTTAESSENCKSWTLQMNGSNMKPRNLGAYPWRLRCLIIQSMTFGFLACGCILDVIGGYWIKFALDIGILAVLLLAVIDYLNYFKNHYEEVY